MQKLEINSESWNNYTLPLNLFSKNNKIFDINKIRLLYIAILSEELEKWAVFKAGGRRHLF